MFVVLSLLAPYGPRIRDGQVPCAYRRRGQRGNRCGTGKTEGPTRQRPRGIIDHVIRLHSPNPLFARQDLISEGDIIAELPHPRSTHLDSLDKSWDKILFSRK